MPRAEPGKKAEARRLVEAEGLSLTAAADAVEVNRGTVRQWQKDDEKAGDPWKLSGHSAEQKARMDALTDEERAAQVERARAATERRWVNRRETEGDAAGIGASNLRAAIMDGTTRYRAAIASGDAGEAATIALGIQRLAVPFGVLFDKAEVASQPLGGGGSTPVTVEDNGNFGDEAAQVMAWADELARARERRAG